MDYSVIPAPVSGAALGSIAGLIAGSGMDCFPVWVGATTGGGLGCIISLGLMLLTDKPEIPVAQVAQVASSDPVIIQNIYFISGAPKTTEKPSVSCIKDNIL